MNQQKLKTFLKLALVEAKKKACEDLKTRTKEIVKEGQKNSIKSRWFVRCLRDLYAKHYQRDCSIRVASAGRPKEFLHDISVFKVECVPSPMEQSEIPRIVDVLWQIESEMSIDAQEFMVDLNKLSAGAYDSNKLYVIQRCWLCDDKNKLTWAEDQIKEIANKQIGSFYGAFVPHPSEWDQPNFERHVKLCKYR